MIRAATTHRIITLGACSSSLDTSTDSLVDGSPPRRRLDKPCSGQHESNVPQSLSIPGPPAVLHSDGSQPPPAPLMDALGMDRTTAATAAPLDALFLRLTSKQFYEADDADLADVGTVHRRQSEQSVLADRPLLSPGRHDFFAAEGDRWHGATEKGCRTGIRWTQEAPAALTAAAAPSPRVGARVITAAVHTQGTAPPHRVTPRGHTAIAHSESALARRSPAYPTAPGEPIASPTILKPMARGSYRPSTAESGILWRRRPNESLDGHMQQQPRVLPAGALHRRPRQSTRRSAAWSSGDLTSCCRDPPTASPPVQQPLVDLTFLKGCVDPLSPSRAPSCSLTPVRDPIERVIEFTAEVSVPLEPLSENQHDSMAAAEVAHAREQLRQAVAAQELGREHCIALQCRADELETQLVAMQERRFTEETVGRGQGKAFEQQCTTVAHSSEAVEAMGPAAVDYHLDALRSALRAEGMYQVPQLRTLVEVAASVWAGRAEPFQLSATVAALSAVAQHLGELTKTFSVSLSSLAPLSAPEDSVAQAQLREAEHLLCEEKRGRAKAEADCLAAGEEAARVRAESEKHLKRRVSETQRDLEAALLMQQHLQEVLDTQAVLITELREELGAVRQNRDERMDAGGEQAPDEVHPHRLAGHTDREIAFRRGVDWSHSEKGVQTDPVDENTSAFVTREEHETCLRALTKRLQEAQTQLDVTLASVSEERVRTAADVGELTSTLSTFREVLQAKEQCLTVALRDSLSRTPHRRGSVQEVQSPDAGAPVVHDAGGSRAGDSLSPLLERLLSNSSLRSPLPQPRSGKARRRLSPSSSQVTASSSIFGLLNNSAEGPSSQPHGPSNSASRSPLSSHEDPLGTMELLVEVRSPVLRASATDTIGNQLRAPPPQLPSRPAPIPQLSPVRPATSVRRVTFAHASPPRRSQPLTLEESAETPPSRQEASWSSVTTPPSTAVGRTPPSSFGSRSPYAPLLSHTAAPQLSVARNGGETDLSSLSSLTRTNASAIMSSPESVCSFRTSAQLRRANGASNRALSRPGFLQELRASWQQQEQMVMGSDSSSFASDANRQ